MESASKPQISFGFSRKKENKLKQLGGSALQADKTEQLEAENSGSSVTEFGSESLKAKDEEKKPVIPLIKTNNWRLTGKSKSKKEENVKDEPKDELQEAAVKEILAEASQQNDSWDHRGEPGEDRNVVVAPILMQNAVPAGFETDDRLDVSIRPAEPEKADYEKIAVESFGLAMLRGMGWQEGRGVGLRHETSVKPVEAKLRPKGLGLGADRGQGNKGGAGAGSQANAKEQEEELEMKKGVFCVVTSGSHKDLYGKVEDVDEDNGRAYVRLTVSGATANLSQRALRLVGAAEYKEFSKYINKAKVDKYKVEEEEKKRRKEEERREKKGSRRDDEDRHRDSPKRRPAEGRGEEHHSKKKKSRKDKDHSASGGEGSSSRAEAHWLYPDITVRFVDRKYKAGKYYNEKVEVVDVLEPGLCCCRTATGTLLHDIKERQVETVIPRDLPAIIKIVRGQHRGQEAQVLKRDKSTSIVHVQLLDDPDAVFQLSFDDASLLAR